MNYVKINFIYSIFLLTSFISISSDECKSPNAGSQQGFISNLAQLEIINDPIEATGEVIYAEVSVDYDTTIQYYSNGDNVTTILTGRDGVRETFINRTGRTHRVFFTEETINQE